MKSSPLLFAVRDGNVEMTRLLLELGADINQASGNHTSPLLIALLNGQVALATQLLAQGGNPNVTDDYHRGPLFAAIELRNRGAEPEITVVTPESSPLWVFGPEAGSAVCQYCSMELV